MIKNLAHIFLASIFFGCSIPDRLTPFLWTELDNANGVISFIGYNEVKWDRLYVIGPYANERNFDRVLMPYKKEIETTGIEMNDHFCVLLLFYKGKLVSLSKVGYTMIDFQKGVKKIDSTIGYYDKTNAIFKYRIDNETGGTRRVIENKAK